MGDLYVTARVFAYNFIICTGVLGGVASAVVTALTGGGAIVFYTSLTLSALLILVLRVTGNFRRLNEKLKSQNESLAQYNEMKSAFLASVVHEINTPLSVISASSRDTLDLLEEPSFDPGEIKDNQQVIEKRVELIDEILTDLMDITAIESGRLILRLGAVNMADLLKNVCDSQFKRLDANGNRIEYDLRLNLPPVPADARRIEQVLTNLLSNAVRHTRGGVITIKLDKRTGDEGGQTVSVTDTGEGMDASVFDAALTQNVSTKADYWRHGIGLNICMRIIEAHGGNIKIDSEKGRGVKVTFELPGLEYPSLGRERSLVG